MRPEKTDTLSVALSLHGGGKDGCSLNIAPYYTHVDDYFDAVKLADFTDMMGNSTSFDQLQFVNQKAEIFGVDLSVAALVILVGRQRAPERAASWLHGEHLPAVHPVTANAAFSAAAIADGRGCSFTGFAANARDAADARWRKGRNSVSAFTPSQPTIPPVAALSANRPRAMQSDVAPPLAHEDVGTKPTALAAYQRQLWARISARKPAGFHLAGVATLRFTVAGDGTLVAIGLVASSGNAVLDRLALRTVRNAAPFSTTSPGVEGDHLVFTIPPSFH